MIVVVFRAHRTEAGDGPEYYAHLARMADIAVTMPGYISHKAYKADDGERLTLFEWQSEETLRDWAQHSEHIEVKKIGRDRFYADYHLQVCQVVRQSRFNR